ncbi:2-hydroxyacid dehydrogenase [Celeribacter litoreus]|uniref:2-hydroxyacid dehydrogenase n=1 Tax=Celeribacter litoreus TaxID=2876714 RepID=UPI001CCC06F4|nr:glyoxylate/hydroxypyruvate reductase A [Celeribacter litoreus]MCA0042229.1 glyoxylate/hydroxypyruvate reductase A [Celeribacter litoreus]
MSLLLLAEGRRAQVWAEVFVDAEEELVIGEAAVGDPAAVTHLACWIPPDDLSRYPNLQVVLSLGAGTDQMPPLPDGVALVRTTAQSITNMVRDWVVMATLMLHRDMPLYLEQATHRDWSAHISRPAYTRRVGILGFGRIGQAVSDQLSALGFDVAAASRSVSDYPNIALYTPQDEAAFLSRTDILICLLPLTPETHGKLNAAYLSQLPKGARIVQAGRGPQLDLEALRSALDHGHIDSAMLDVTDPEPLPSDHWVWGDPRVILTPHIGSVTDDREGAEHALSVMRARADGKPIPGLVHPERGY